MRPLHIDLTINNHDDGCSYSDDDDNGGGAVAATAMATATMASQSILS